jgi:hypothetical protein|tara:strand:- start:2672 stop:3310 length:639 start_codon:yes stop_codon:yes gene_type:complete
MSKTFKICHINNETIKKTFIFNGNDETFREEKNEVTTIDDYIHLDDSIKRIKEKIFMHTVLINWLVYGTSNLQTYDKNKTVFEQFTMREEYSRFWNTFIKSFVRPKLIEKIGNVHITYNENYKVCNIYNNILTINDPNKCDYPDINLNDNSPLVIVHYMTLDYESMLNKRNKNALQCLGFTLKENKYSLEWYKSEIYGFKDNIKDLRMKVYK